MVKIEFKIENKFHRNSWIERQMNKNLRSFSRHFSKFIVRKCLRCGCCWFFRCCCCRRWFLVITVAVVVVGPAWWEVISGWIWPAKANKNLAFLEISKVVQIRPIFGLSIQIWLKIGRKTMSRRQLRMGTTTKRGDTLRKRNFFQNFYFWGIPYWNFWNSSLIKFLPPFNIFIPFRPFSAFAVTYTNWIAYKLCTD